MRDPLIGKWFLAAREPHDGSKASSWRGQIIGKPGGGVFLCCVESGARTLVSLGDWRGWKVYDSKELMDADRAGLSDRRPATRGGRERAGDRS